jgi:hypothetical protein
MDERTRLLRLKLKENFEHYAAKCLKIRTKSGSIEPFILNKAQKYIHERLEKQLRETGKIRAIVLKARQQGCSSYIGARLYHKVTHSFGIQAFILTHSLEATNNLFKMAKRFYEHTPALVKPQVATNNSKELVFNTLDSGYKLGTAENKNVGRSATIQLAHFSESAFWNNAADHATGVMQAIPNANNTEVILESTANGVGNYFHQEWQKAETGESEFIAIFIPWFWQDEYASNAPEDFKRTVEEDQLVSFYKLSDDQLNWRRKKIIELSVNGMDGAKAFLQEYPSNSQSAFQLTGEDSYIPSDIVVRARHCDINDKYGPLIIGVDPARFGDDRTAIIRRQGRRAYKLESHIKLDTMQVAGRVHTIILEENPDMVCIDVGGLGAGVVDRLNEMGHRDIVYAINAGGSPLNGGKYSNKRAEMWGELHEWLRNEPCSIPDDDALHSDLCSIRYKVDSNSRLVMEQKADMKRRGVRSSDLADSLGLTFAMPPTTARAGIGRDEKVKSMAESFNKQLKAKQNSRMSNNGGYG